MQKSFESKHRGCSKGVHGTLLSFLVGSVMCGSSVNAQTSTCEDARCVDTMEGFSRARPCGFMALCEARALSDRVPLSRVSESWTFGEFSSWLTPHVTPSCTDVRRDNIFEDKIGCRRPAYDFYDVVARAGDTSPGGHFWGAPRGDGFSVDGRLRSQGVPSMVRAGKFVASFESRAQDTSGVSVIETHVAITRTHEPHVARFYSHALGAPAHEGCAIGSPRVRSGVSVVYLCWWNVSVSSIDVRRDMVFSWAVPSRAHHTLGVYP